MIRDIILSVAVVLIIVFLAIYIPFHPVPTKCKLFDRFGWPDYESCVLK